MLNLACSDNVGGGFSLGRITNVIGNSQSGKSMLMLTTLAEIAADPRFNNHTLYYDDCEGAMDFNLPGLFGNRLTERLIFKHSNYIEEVHQNLKDLEPPFFYVVDSLDSLTTIQEEVETDKKIKTALEKGDAKGEMAMDKPKKISRLLRQRGLTLKKNNSSLFVISQTRDNVSNPFGPTAVSGGRALEFYCHHRLFLKYMGPIEKLDIQIGNKVALQVRKNKVTGKHRQVNFFLYNDYGIDDVQSNINFLLTSGHWKTEGKKIAAKEFGITTMKDALIKKIEEGGLEFKLRMLTKKQWMAIEEKLKTNRKPKYE